MQEVVKQIILSKKVKEEPFLLEHEELATQFLHPEAETLIEKIKPIFGFKTKQEKIFEKMENVANKLTLIRKYYLLKRIPFKRVELVMRGYNTTVHDHLSFLGYSIGQGQYLVEIKIDDYKAYVPPQVYQIIEEMKKQSFTKFRIWAIANYWEMQQVSFSAVKQVKHKVQNPSYIDPLLVAYIPKSEYVALGAMWGKDLEDLDKFFSSSS